MGKAQQPVVVGVVRLKPLRECLQQHGHTEEQPGYFDQGEPFRVVASDGHKRETTKHTKDTKKRKRQIRNQRAMRSHSTLG
jgi:hypothetical protein